MFFVRIILVTIVLLCPKLMGHNYFIKKGILMELDNLTEILNNSLKFVGTRQVLKGIEGKEISKVYLANNIDKSILERVSKACKTHNIPYEVVCAKEVLGHTCKIDVPCAVVGVRDKI